MRGRPDQQRFEVLLREHGGIVFKVAALYARGAADREDLAQEIRTQLWRSFRTYDERRARFSTWMYRVALNVAISHLRRDSRAHSDRCEPLDAHHLETMGGGDPVEEKDERITTMYVCIDQFDAFNRALILLYLEDRSYAEIANVLGISETNVATKIGRIKQKLRVQMAAAETITTGA